MTEEVVNKEVVVPETPDVETPVVSEAEQKATSFGWKDKEKWVEAGNKEEDWVPAKQFLYIGDLKQQVIGKDKELNKANKLVKMMKNHHLNVKQQAYEDAVKSLKAEKKEALEAGDLVRVETIRDKMEEERESFIQATKAIPQEVQQAETEPVIQSPPEYYEFKSKNPWYVEADNQKDEMSRRADALGTAIIMETRQAGRQVNVADVYKEVEKSIRKLYPEKFETPPSPHTTPSKSGPKSTSKVNLTDEELQVAKNFGLSPEKYAEQLKSYKGR